MKWLAINSFSRPDDNKLRLSRTGSATMEPNFELSVRVISLSKELSLYHYPPLGWLDLVLDLLYTIAAMVSIRTSLMMKF